MSLEARELSVLEILPPQSIPKDEELLGWSERCRAAVPTTQAPHPVSNLELIHDLEATLLRLPPIVQQAAPSAGSQDDTAHDAFFHIRRVRGTDAAIFVRMIICARLTLARESARAPCSPEDAPCGLIDGALFDLLSSLGIDAGRIEHWVQDGDSREPAITRWIRGHQIFAALTQGLILGFNALAQALRTGDHAALAQWADVCIGLFRASGAALQFTGDFSVDDYNLHVRPSMTEPASPVNLSGLMSADHRWLAKVLRDMRPALKSLHAQEFGRHQALAAAVANTYDSHIHVCRRFVGAKTSLFMTGKSEQSAPSVIAQFKAVRLKAFEHGQRVERLDPKSID